MTDVNWFTLNREQQMALYPQLVRQIFSRTASPGPEETNALMPIGLGPEVVQIEITTYCNLKCRECGRTKGVNEGTWVSGNMALDTYKEVIAKLPPASKVFLQGVGEPSMHPHFEELIRLAVESGKYREICFNSNGLPHKDEFWAELARKYPSISPALSIDSLDPVVAERCRSGTNAEMLFHRLRLFHEIFPNLIVALVASRMNLDDIPLTLEKIASVGPILVGIQDVITDDKTVELGADDHTRLSTLIDAALAKSPNLKVHWGTKSTGLKRCIAPFLANFVTLEGHLTPCCALTTSEPFSQTSLLGDVSWDEVRSAPGVERWMRDYLVADPEPCRHCTFNPALDREADRRGVRASG